VGYSIVYDAPHNFTASRSNTLSVTAWHGAEERELGGALTKYLRRRGTARLARHDRRASMTWRRATLAVVGDDAVVAAACYNAMISLTQCHAGILAAGRCLPSYYASSSTCLM